MARTDVMVAQTAGLIQYDGGGTQYLIEANNGSLYLIYMDTGSDVAFRKSNNGGKTWSSPTIIFAGTATALSVWYDRWSNISADLIHIAYVESVTDDTFYRTINTASSDALSTQTTIFLGASTAAGGHLSITRAVGGNVYCKTVIDAGAEGGFFRLPNANVPNGAWDAARTVDEVIATQDAMILVPDLTAADNQDIMAIFWDTSANEISRKLYDDSGNTWSETSIATSMTKLTTATGFPNFAISIDLTNSQILLAAWSAVDTLNADLRFWTITNSSISEKTNVVLNSTDDQALCAIALDTANDDWYVFYVGKSDGTETWTSSVNIYYKVSTDGGTTWSAETKLSETAFNIRWLITNPRFTGNIPPLVFLNDITLDELMVNVYIPEASSATVGGRIIIT